MERVVCETCNVDLTQNVRIQCAHEACADLSVCIPCFANGAEIGSHRNFHPYRVIDKISFPIYEKEWGADEELRLLEGLTLRGMGNWIDVADHVETRTKVECEEHYLRVYVNSPTWPIPRDFPKGVDTLSHRKKRKLGGGEKKRTWISGPCYHPEVYGFMPARGEFEMEAENEAEMDVKSVSFSPDDSDVSREYKLTLLEIYNERLDRRLRRRNFVLERGFLNYRAHQQYEKAMPKEDRDLLQSLKVYTPLLTKEDADTFIEGILRERQLRQRIALLQEWRLNGIRSQDEGLSYEYAKSARASGQGTRGSAPLTREGSLHLAGTSSSPFPGHGTPGGPSGSGASRHGQGKREDGSSGPGHHHVTPTPPKGKLIGRKQAVPLDITDAPDVHLLSAKEVELCSNLRLLPQAYLPIKATVIREASRRTTMRKRDARDHIKIDVNKIGALWDFWVASGWIRPASANKPDANRAAAQAAAAAAATATAQTSGPGTTVSSTPKS
ncbi:MAG: hypothetical protein DHS80DRAFT_11582 [Piptocephalis tieghemiana]|nr:MAG: hypothetical protein DHS80DRAFT_11582 [Piptocephalis tieghemiana]